MTVKQQLSIFGEQCWESQKIDWQVLERDERTRDTADALAHIESHTGKLPANTILIPVQVLYVPGSNFFLMPLLEEEIEEIEEVEIVG